MTVKIYQAKESATGEIETVALCDLCYGNWKPVGGITLLSEADIGTPCKRCQPEEFDIHLDEMRSLLERVEGLNDG